MSSWTFCMFFGHLQFMYSITSAMNNLIYLSSQNSLSVLNHYKNVYPFIVIYVILCLDTNDVNYFEKLQLLFCIQNYISKEHLDLRD